MFLVVEINYKNTLNRFGETSFSGLAQVRPKPKGVFDKVTMGCTHGCYSKRLQRCRDEEIYGPLGVLRVLSG